MKIFGCSAVAAFILLMAGGATAAEPVIGPPLDFTSRLIPQPGTYELAPLRAADPDGGPPWGIATYFAPLPTNDRVVVLCTEYGRVVEDRLGLITTADVFRPYQSGLGPLVGCGGLDARAGERASGNALRLVPRKIGNACSPAGQLPVGPACTSADTRTVISASLGKGILSAQVKNHGSRRWKPLPVTPDGLLLVVRAGRFTDVTVPEIRVRATVCGPDARTDIRAWRMVRQGCSITFAVPDGPRPAPETTASRRARAAPRLDASVKVIERRDRASFRRYVARLRVPITVRTYQEGYAAEVRGPSGPRCDKTGRTDTGREYLTSYLQVAGKDYDLPLLPIDFRRGVWCRGRYTVTVLFKRRLGDGPRARTSRKIVATTTFRIR